MRIIWKEFLEGQKGDKGRNESGSWAWVRNGTVEGCKGSFRLDRSLCIAE